MLSIVRNDTATQTDVSYGDAILEALNLKRRHNFALNSDRHGLAVVRGTDAPITYGVNDAAVPKEWRESIRHELRCVANFLCPEAYGPYSLMRHTAGADKLNCDHLLRSITGPGVVFDYNVQAAFMTILAAHPFSLQRVREIGAQRLIDAATGHLNFTHGDGGQAFQSSGVQATN